MADGKISENIEEYLEVLYCNGNNGEQVSTTQLSKDLKQANAADCNIGGVCPMQLNAKYRGFLWNRYLHKKCL